jgi:prepilin peptidase CpaA
MNSAAVIQSVFLALLFVAALYDVMYLRIPNLVTAGLAGLFLVAAPLVPAFGLAGWAGHLASGLGMFVAGALLFRLGVFGGGDVKLLAAAALWAGPYALPMYLILVALSGGAVAIFFWLLRKLLEQAVLALPGERAVRLPTVLSNGAGIPYGLAIAAGLIGIIVWAVRDPFAWFWFKSVHGPFLHYFANLRT